MMDKSALEDILHAFYMLVGVLERLLNKSPTTKELREMWRRDGRDRRGG